MDAPTFIKQIRKDLDMTQAQLAEAVGKQRSNISLWETGRTIPPGDIVLKLLEIRTPSCWSILNLNPNRCLCEKQALLSQEQPA